MKIEWRGETYSLDLLEVTTKQAEQINLYTGTQTLEEWETQLADSRKPAWPKAVTAAWWLMVAQNGGDPGRLPDADIAFLKFGTVLAEAYAAEQAADEPDPTTAAVLTGGTPTGTTTGSGGSGAGTSANSGAPTSTPSPATAAATPSSSTS